MSVKFRDMLLVLAAGAGYFLTGTAEGAESAFDRLRARLGNKGYKTTR